MKEQNQNMRTFCALLGEAQTVMQQLATQLHITSDMAKAELERPSTRNKSKPSRSEEDLSKRLETNENEPATTFFREADESGRVTIGTQAELDEDEEEEEDTFNFESIDRNNGDDCGNTNDQHESVEALLKDPDYDSSPDVGTQLPLKPNQIELEILDGFRKMRVAEKMFTSDLGTISERTEVSTLSTKSKDTSSGTNEKSIERGTSKQPKPLNKTIGVDEISDAFKIAETTQVEANHTRLNEEEDSKKAKVGSKPLERSTRNRLSIQILPSIDIKRSLVTQKIPEIVITAAESVPHYSVPKHSNVGYEIVKDYSTDSEVESKVSQLDLKNNSGPTIQLQPAKQIDDGSVEFNSDDLKERVFIKTNSRIRVNKIPSGGSSKGFASRAKVSAESLPQPTLVTKPTSSDRIIVKRQRPANKFGTSSNDADNSATSSEGAFKTTSAEELCMLTTHFRNESFNYETESVGFNFDDINGKPSRDTIISSKSDFVEILFGKGNETSDTRTQDHVDDVVEDPDSRTVLKSHQLMESESEFPLVADVDDEVDSEDVGDVHNIFVNPDTRPILSQSSKKPPEFCASKSTQCNDHDPSDPMVVLKDFAFKWDTSQTCSKTTLDGDVLETQLAPNAKDLPNTWALTGQAPRMTVVEVAQATWNKGLFRRPTHQPTTSNPTIPTTFSTNLPRSGSIRKSSAIPRMDGTSSNHQPGDRCQVNPSLEKCNLIESSHTLQQIDQDVADKMQAAASWGTTGSLHSENTEDLIFEIDRETLRLESQHLMQSIEDVGFTTGKSRQILNNNNKDSDGKNKPKMLKEYVALQDVATSVPPKSVSDVLLDSHIYNTQSFYSIAVGDDTLVRKDDDQVTPNTSCCAKFRWKSPRKEAKSARVTRLQPRPMPKRSSLAKTFDNDSQPTQRKSVTIEEPFLGATSPELLPEKLRRRLLRESVSPAVPTQARHLKKDDLAIAAKALRQPDVLTAFENPYTSSYILNPIKTTSGAWALEQRSNQDPVVKTPEAANVKESDSRDVAQTFKEITEDPTKDNIDLKLDKGEQPEIVIRETDYTKTKPSSILDHDVDLQNLFGQRTSAPHEHVVFQDVGTSSRHPKQVQSKRSSDTTSSDATTTSSSVTGKTEETISEGEVKHRSVGEVLRRSHPKGFKLLQYFKTHPQALLKYEFGDPGLKVKRQRQFNSNWVAYYVSKSPSPELSTTESSVGRVE